MRVRGPKIRFYDSREGDKIRFCESKMGRRSMCILSLVCLRLQFKFLLKFKRSRSLSEEGVASFLPPLSEALLHKMLISILQCDLK